MVSTQDRVTKVLSSWIEFPGYLLSKWCIGQRMLMRNCK